MNDDMAEKWMIIRKQTNENSVLTYIHCEKFYCLEKKERVLHPDKSNVRNKESTSNPKRSNK
jgi:hypothetical protein